MFIEYTSQHNYLAHTCDNKLYIGFLYHVTVKDKACVQSSMRHIQPKHINGVVVSVHSGVIPVILYFFSNVVAIHKFCSPLQIYETVLTFVWVNRAVESSFSTNIPSELDGLFGSETLWKKSTSSSENLKV